MRKIVTYIAVFVLSTANAHAQTKFDSTDAYLLDFSVPDMPAFKALGTEASDILRPSDLRKFGAMLSPFFNGKDGIVPNNFALEVAPWKLLSNNWTLTDYNNKKPLYHTGFSLGTVRNTAASSSKVALGMRVSFIPEKSDVIRHATKEIARLQGPLLLAIVGLENAYNRLPDAVRPPSISRLIEKLVADPKSFGPEVQTAWEAVEEEVGTPIPNTVKSEQQLLSFYKTTVLDTVISNFKKNNWNATRYDIAASFVAESPDTFLSKSQFSSFHFWGTAGWRVGKRGQLLLGSNLVLPRTEPHDSVTKIDFAISSRVYLGNDDFRGFLESQYKLKNYDLLDQVLLFNLGAEFRLSNKFWITASAGINNYLDEPAPLNKLVSSVDIRYGFNEPANK